MRVRVFAADELVKPDADVEQLLTARLSKLSTLSPNGSHERSAAAAAVISASRRAAMLRRNGITADVATGSPVSASRTIAKQQVSAHALLVELEQLLERAWDYAAERMGASATRASSSTVGSFKIAALASPAQPKRHRDFTIPTSTRAPIH